MEDVSVIVPFFNERGRVERTVAELLSWGLFERVIAVDDGSSDGGLREQFEGERFELVKLTENKGKGAAVKAGLEKVDTQAVMLFDADLSRVRSVDFAPVVKMWLKQAKGMVLFKRVETFWTSKLMKFDLWFTGERLLLADELRAVYEEYDPKGYELEHAINQHIFHRNEPVFWAPVAAKNTFKIHKRPITEAVKSEYVMSKQVMADGRWKEYVAYLMHYEGKMARLGEEAE